MRRSKNAADDLQRGRRRSAGIHVTARRGASFDEKNIGDVYDALNVLMAMGIISKEKKNKVVRPAVRKNPCARTLGDEGIAPRWTSEGSGDICKSY